MTERANPFIPISGSTQNPPDSFSPSSSEPVYDGEAGRLTALAFGNAVLSLLTLGIYRFWGKTRIRRYLWSHVSWMGDRFEYTGKGIELFLGFLIAVAVLVPLILALQFVEVFLADKPILLTVSAFVQVFVFVALIQFAIYRARRYRLSRTSWRGIRAGQDGSALTYVGLSLLWGGVTLITLGVCYPIMRTRLQAYRMEHTWFGDESFTFDGRAADLFGIWMIAYLLWLPTLGLSYLWYRVREFRYFAGRTGFMNLEFTSDLKASKIIVTVLIYSVLAYGLIAAAMAAMFYLIPGDIFTSMDPEAQMGAGEGLEALGAWDPLAILSAVAIFIGLMVLLQTMFLVLFLQPILRATCNSLTVHGELELGALLQSQQSAPSRAEGLVDAFDVGAI